MTSTFLSQYRPVIDLHSESQPSLKWLLDMMPSKGEIDATNKRHRRSNKNKNELIFPFFRDINSCNSSDTLHFPATVQETREQGIYIVHSASQHRSPTVHPLMHCECTHIHRSCIYRKQTKATSLFHFEMCIYSSNAPRTFADCVVGNCITLTLLACLLLTDSNNYNSCRAVG